jgi:hypothetical protein
MEKITLNELTHWGKINRGERFYCFDLYNQLKANDAEKDFIKWLCKGIVDDIDLSNSSIFPEVSFYRDLIYLLQLKSNNKIKNKSKIKGSLQRTFDLCVFSKKFIIVIEAKVHEGLSNNQIVTDKNKMVEFLQEITDEGIDVFYVGLVTRSYWQNAKNKFEVFNKIITWEEIAEAKEINGKYIMPKRIEEIYNDKSKYRKLPAGLSKSKIVDILMET